MNRADSSALYPSAARSFLAIGGVFALTLAALHATALITTTQALGASAIGVLGAGLAWRGLGAHTPQRRFGAANTITLGRLAAAALIGGAALAAIDSALAWLVALLAWAALASDAIDGYCARAQGTQSDFGARFDMETDAFLALALCAALVAMGKMGAWIIALGAMRYAFILAGHFWPAMTAPLPPSQRRRAICAVQIGALATASLPLVEPFPATMIAGAALAATAYSFAVDTFRLVRHDPRRSKPCASV
jgi:phosphatidylglycerophosphate synthase